MASDAGKHRWPSPRGGPSDPNAHYRMTFMCSVPGGRRLHRKGRHRHSWEIRPTLGGWSLATCRTCGKSDIT